MENKQCSKCKVVKPISEFYIMRKGNKPYPYCKDCKRVYRQQWNANNPDANKRWYENNREKRIIQARMSRKEQPEKHQEIQRKYRENNREKINERMRNLDPNKRRAYKQARRARQAQGGGAFTPQEWLTLCQRYNNLCVCCGQAKPLSADHIIPVSKGGSSYIENIQPLCKVCNSAKGDQTIDYRPDQGAGVERIPRPPRKIDRPKRWHRAYEVSPRGEQHTQSKLTEEQVHEIRRKHREDRMTCTEIAKIYNVAKSTITRIVKRQSWTHI